MLASSTVVRGKVCQLPADGCGFPPGSARFLLTIMLATVAGSWQTFTRTAGEEASMIFENRANIWERFIRFASIAYRGFRRSLIHKFEGRDTTELFRYVHYIITQYGGATEEDVFTQKQRLIRQLSTVGLRPGVQSGLMSRFQGKHLRVLLTRHVEGLASLTHLTKDISKRLDRFKDQTLPISQKCLADVMAENAFLSNLKADLKELSNKTNTQIVLMACIDQKMEEYSPFDEPIKLLIYKMVNMTWSLVKSYNNKTDDAAVMSEFGQKMVKKTRSDDAYDKSEHRATRKTQKFCKVAPWPLKGDFDDYMGRKFKHVNYDMFLASSYKPTNSVTPDVSPTPSVEVATTLSDSMSSLQNSDEAIYPWRGHSNIDSYMKDVYRRGVDYEIFLATAFKPQTAANEKRESQTCESRDESIRLSGGMLPPRITPLSQRYDVYVQATAPHMAKNSTELSLKVGQILKQKRPANSDGMAYGWSRSSRMAFKRTGFYPVDCVQLLTDNKHAE